MKALTVWQPWAWAIGAGLKGVENRDWYPTLRQLRPGDELAIHAGQHEPTKAELWAVRDAARKMGRLSEVPSLGGHELGSHFGRGRVVAVVRYQGAFSDPTQLTETERLWFVGKYGWRLNDVRQLNLGSAPKVGGAQGLWELPAGVEDLVRQQLATAEGELWRRRSA